MPNFDNFDYLERVDDTSPNRGQFSYENSSLTFTYLVERGDLKAKIVEVLGSVAPTGDGGLTRVLPAAHPEFENFFATRISGLVGKGKPEQEELNPLEVEAPRLVDAVASYPVYEMTVEFQPFPFTVLPDSYLGGPTVGTEINDDGDPEPVLVTDEMLRFVDVVEEVSGEVLTAQTGQMKFRRGDGAGVGEPKPHLHTFPQFPWMYVPKGKVVMRWHRVPESYVASQNSYLKSLRGRINQSEMEVHQYLWPAGSLLYTGYRTRRYQPPVPRTVTGTLGVQVYEKVLDIDLEFMEVNRATPSAPTPANANWLAAGHNLAPCINVDRQFYYVSADDPDPEKQYPLYRSAELKRLFTDPDV